MSPKMQGNAHLTLTLLILACLAAIGGAALAQETRGTITGVVTDSSGGVLPGASVIITNTATSVAVKTATNDEGRFTAPLLIPGQYSVTVEASGFKKLARANVELRVAERLALELKLEPGQLQETVTVSSETGSLLETATATKDR